MVFESPIRKVDSGGSSASESSFVLCCDVAFAAVASRCNFLILRRFAL